MRIVGMTVLILSIIGCGGGGGGGGSDCGGGDEPFYAGRWHGSTVLVRNTCPRGIDIQGEIPFDLTVNQAGRDIVVDNNSNGTTFSGELEDDDTGFVAVVSTIRTGSGASACTATPGLSFYDLNDDHADVLFLLLLDCSSGISCELGYAGQGRRD